MNKAIVRVQPVLTIENTDLHLSPIPPSAADRITELAGDRDVAEMTEAIPHPYPEGLSLEWIESTHEDFRKGHGVVFGINHNDTQTLVGCCGLVIDTRNKCASLGYWIGKSHWGKGYATAAAGSVVNYGFTDFDLHRIESEHIETNLASGRVMEKIGMNYECTRRQAAFRHEKYVSVIGYSIINPAH